MMNRDKQHFVLYVFCYSSLSEKMRIQKLVDKHIKAMNTNMEVCYLQFST